MPKLLLQPLPQCPAADPHQPYWLQHLPKDEPEQVNPLVPAQVPSVETFLVATGVGVAAGFTDDTAAEPEQVPKAALHDEPQWSPVDPHQPYWLQHEPYEEPAQVNPLAPAQVPSVETLPPGAEEGAAALVDVAGLGVGEAALELTMLEPQLPKPDWQPDPQYSDVVPH